MFSPRQDNVLLALEPLSATTAGGIVIPGFEYKTGPDGAEGKRKRDFDPRRKRAQLRRARVLAVGPGHHPGCTKCGGSKPHLIPTTLRPGDIVWIDAVAGDDWSLDKSAPRHHTKPLNFEQVGDHVGELRIVREEECQLFESDDLPDTQRDPSTEAPDGPPRGLVATPEAPGWYLHPEFVERLAYEERMVPRWPSEDSGVEE